MFVSELPLKTLTLIFQSDPKRIHTHIEIQMENLAMMGMPMTTERAMGLEILLDY